jgi:outer membrane protein
MKIISLSALGISIISLCCFFYLWMGSTASKTAYVKNQVLFNDFKLTKELKSKFENTDNARRHILDSLLLDYKYRASGKKANPQQLALLERNYYEKKEAFEQQNTELTENYDKQIWTRINQYVKEYCKSKQYDYVFGVSGDGALMYAGESHDITAEVVEYMNTSYDGGK